MNGIRTIRLASALLAAAIACGASPSAPAACVEPEPRAYRTDDYRSPTPCTLHGATVVHTEEVSRLLDARGAILVDVLPSPRLPKGFPADALWLPKPRWNIPGSVWIANAGFGVPPVEEEAHFREQLERLTRGDKDRALIFYCLANCWMSWNAAKRAVEWGYRAVHWYPEGSDGWSAAGFALEENTPLPLETGEAAR